MSISRVDLPQGLLLANQMTSAVIPQPRINRRKVIYSTLSTEAMQYMVERHYDMPGFVECKLYQRGLNDTYLVSTAAGDYALKIYRSSWRTRQAILAELAAIEHLDCHDIPVAKGVPRKDGRLSTSISAPEGKRHAVLFRWLQGHAPAYTDPAETRQLGSSVARLHAAGDSLAPNPALRCLDFDYLVNQPLRHIRQRVKYLPSITARLNALADRMCRRFDKANASLADWGFCHGDIWSNNALLDGNRLVIFDFDWCGSGWRVLDIAAFRWHTRYVGVEQVAWRPFIEGYLKVRPEGVRLLECVPLFMIIRHLWVLSIWIGLAEETGISAHSESYFAKSLAFCEHIEADAAGEWI